LISRAISEILSTAADGVAAVPQGEGEAQPALAVADAE
jgi:hypothetical protein